MSLTVACAQIAPAKGDLERNLSLIGDSIIQAGGEGVDLVVLPEAATTGYFLEGGVLEASLTREALARALHARLAGRIERPIDALVGFYERFEGNLYNSAAYLEIDASRVEVRAVYHKFFLPTYGVFDEERFVSRGSELGIVDTRFGRFGILLCEDVWHSILPTILAIRGAQVMLIPSASPGRGFTGETIDNLDRYRRLMRAVSEEHGVYCVNCQLCGFEGGKGFVGGSMVIDPMGRVVAESPVIEPHLLVAKLDLDLVSLARAQSPLISDLQSAWSDIHRLLSED